MRVKVWVRCFKQLKVIKLSTIWECHWTLPWKHLATTFHKTIATFSLPLRLSLGSRRAPLLVLLVFHLHHLVRSKPSSLISVHDFWCSKPNWTLSSSRPQLTMAVTHQPGRFQMSGNMQADFETYLFDCCDDCGVCEHALSPFGESFQRQTVLASPDSFPSLSIRLANLVLPLCCGLLHRQRHGRVLHVRPGHAHPQRLQDQIQHQSKTSMPVWKTMLSFNWKLVAKTW